MQPIDSVTRRRFLASTSCLGAAIALRNYLPLPVLGEDIAQDARLGKQPIADKGYASVRQIGDGVYATISDPTKGFTTLANGGFIIGKDAVLMVEGFLSVAGAAFQLETLRSVTQTPVRGAVDTHYHFDHSLGNATYGSAGIPIWAHAKAAELMVKNYAMPQGHDMTAILDAYKKKVSDAANDTEREHAQSDLNAYTLIFQTIASSAVCLPNQPLDPAKLPITVDLGGRQAIIETHPGHTPTDIILRVPEQNIVFTGDLLFNGFIPVTFDATMSAWRAVLAKFAALDKDTLFVPGHGQLCGQEAVANLRAIFDDLAEQAEKMYKAGVSVEEAVKRYTVPDKFKGYFVFAWSLTVGSSMAKLYEEFKAGKT